MELINTVLNHIIELILAGMVIYFLFEWVKGAIKGDD